MQKSTLDVTLVGLKLTNGMGNEGSVAMFQNTYDFLLLDLRK